MDLMIVTFYIIVGTIVAQALWSVIRFFTKQSTQYYYEKDTWGNDVVISNPRDKDE